MGRGLGRGQVTAVLRIVQLVTIGALLIAPMVSFSALRFDAAWTNAPVDSAIFPVAPDRYRFVMPDGEWEDFEYRPLEMYPLVGRGGWVGEWQDERRDYLRLLKLEKRFPSKDGREFLFKRGRLIYAKSDRKSGSLQLAFRPVTEDGPVPPLDSFWARRETPKQPVTSSGLDIWSDSGRLRLWFLNPNLASVLLLQLVLVATAGFFAARKVWVRAGALALTAGLALAFVRTSSRGGTLALLAGLLVLGGFAFARRLKGRSPKVRAFCIAGVLLAACAAVAAVWCFAPDRFGAGFFNQDPSTDRLAIWRAVPGMLADAPGGWGFGNAGCAYMSWYCDLARTHVVRTLISSHLTWIVEFGIVGGVAYVLAWMLALGLTFRSARRGGSALPLALVLSFFVAAVFNPVLEGVELWILPLAGLAVALRRLVRQDRKGLLAALDFALVTTLVLLSVGLAAVENRAPGKWKVCAENGSVRLNGERPSVWIVDDSDFGCALSNFAYTGREIRGQYLVEPALPSLGYVESVDDLPFDADRIAVAGKSCADYLDRWRMGKIRVRPRRLDFISPPFPPSAVPPELVSSCDFRLIAGSLVADCWPRGETCPPWTVVVTGCGLYLPSWLDYVTGLADPHDDAVPPNALRE